MLILLYSFDKAMSAYYEGIAAPGFWYETSFLLPHFYCKEPAPVLI